MVVSVSQDLLVLQASDESHDVDCLRFSEIRELQGSERLVTRPER